MLDAAVQPKPLTLAPADGSQIVPADPLDRLEVAMCRHEMLDLPVYHSFTAGLYARTIHMPAGSLITSKIHKTEHPYVITKGSASVWIAGVGWQRLEAGHRGITRRGTRRLLYIHEDCEWTTYHPIGEMGITLDGCGSDEERVARIEAAIIQPRNEHLAGLLPPKQIMDALESHVLEGVGL